MIVAGSSGGSGSELVIGLVSWEMLRVVSIFSSLILFALICSWMKARDTTRCLTQVVTEFISQAFMMQLDGLLAVASCCEL